VILTKSMLASKTTDSELQKLCYPVLASPKLDGIRASVQGGQLLSRNLKLIPNEHTQHLYGSVLFEGLDGELICGSPTHKDVFRNTSSAVMSMDGTPDINFYVFDKFYKEGIDRFDQVPFEQRMQAMTDAVSRKRGSLIGMFVVPQKLINNYDELLGFEAECLSQGFEGAMVRDPRAPYKKGRSTVREGYLLKVKRFMDSEAIVVGIEERFHNANEAWREPTGRLKRRATKDGREPMGTMGSLFVRDMKTNIEFNVGSGFDDSERKDVWENPHAFLNRVLTYRYFPTGSKDRPRFPVFVGWRAVVDL